jgi:hypothetical protein
MERTFIFDQGRMTITAFLAVELEVGVGEGERSYANGKINRPAEYPHRAR